MDPSINSKADESNGSNVSLINPDSETTLYLEDDNNSYGVSDLHLQEAITSPKVDEEIKHIWSNDHTLNLRNNDEVIDVLTPEQIRWFYKSLASKQWVEFNGYDSLRIERRYRNLTDTEWKYYNSTYRSKKNKTPTPSPTVECLKYSNNDMSKQDGSLNSEELTPPSSETADRVVVRGGLYEVDLLKRNCASIFWPGRKQVLLDNLHNCNVLYYCVSI